MTAPLADGFVMCSNMAGILDSGPLVKAKDARTQNRLRNTSSRLANSGSNVY